jgi:D-alanyl-D-alanine carboxypeptidase/D-alanyl-D-alanine-endopeptidase (penicillin-binding protein 4)
MKDGAGLSRANRLSPSQLVELLQAFKPWKRLLPEIEPGVFAKSGTLNKVSTLAGYIQKNGQLKPFAIMMNQGVPYKLRNRIARELARK